jgi:hypothetical protein
MFRVTENNRFLEGKRKDTIIKKKFNFKIRK